MQPGDGYNVNAGQNGTTLTILDDLGNTRTGQPDQFRVLAVKNSTDTWAIYIRKGFVEWPGFRAGDPHVQGVYQGEVQQVWCYPTDSKVAGPFDEFADSPLTDKGGYIQLDDDDGSWGVYLISCSGFDDINIPYLAVIKDGSDADTKSDTFKGIYDMQIIAYALATSQSVEVTTPDGPTYLSIQSVQSQQKPYNYNCQKWKIATLTWEDNAYKVEQLHLGPFCMPNPVNYQGVYNYDPDNPPSWITTPYYDDKLTDWLGSWSGYQKTPFEATVIL